MIWQLHPAHANRMLILIIVAVDVASGSCS